MPTAIRASRCGSSSAWSGVPIVMSSALVDFTASARLCTPASFSRSRTGTPSQVALPSVLAADRVGDAGQGDPALDHPALEQVLVAELDLPVDHPVDPQREAVDRDVGHAQGGVDAVELPVRGQERADPGHVEAGAGRQRRRGGRRLRQRDVTAGGCGGRATEALADGAADRGHGADGDRGLQEAAAVEAGGQVVALDVGREQVADQQPGLAVLDGLPGVRAAGRVEHLAGAGRGAGRGLGRGGRRVRAGCAGRAAAGAARRRRPRAGPGRAAPAARHRRSRCGR